jgi:hypothetical protein
MPEQRLRLFLRETAVVVPDHQERGEALREDTSDEGDDVEPVAEWVQVVQLLRRVLIRSRQYVLDSDWGETQPGAETENAFLESHSWEEYSE